MAKSIDQIIEMIKNLDLQDDGINMNHKIKSIEQDFCNLIKDEQMLSESMDYINDHVLDDGDASLKFALLFSSRNFDSLAMHDTKVRCKMLNILQRNYSNAEQFRNEKKDKLFNSITLLGEYYHRVRLADGSPIDILGESLLQLLIQEIEFINENRSNNILKPLIDSKLAKLILSQVTLNGSILRLNHKNDLNTLFYYIRKNLIEQDDLTTIVKALLLMTLDLYYNNFNSLTPALEEMYTKHLIENEETSDLKENNTPQASPIVKKTWSEQVCEDSLYEHEQENTSLVDVQENNNECESPSNIGEHEEFQYQSLPPRPTKFEDDQGPILKPPPPRDYFPRKTNNFRSISPNDESRQGSVQRRLYPNQNNRNHKNFNRYSANYDDDRRSVTSEGGRWNQNERGPRMERRDSDFSSRERIDKNNWDRGSGFHTYDGRRNNSRNNQNYKNRNTYDKPPRFRNLDKDHPSWRNSSQERYNQNNTQGSTNIGGGGGNDSRSSSINRTFPRMNNRHGSYDPYTNNDNYRGGHHNKNYERYDKYKNYNKGGNNITNNYQQSNENLNAPEFDSHNQQRPQLSRNFSRSNNGGNNERYGSHHSLSSVDSNTWRRRSRPKNRDSYNRKSNDWSDTNSVHENENQKSNNTWNDGNKTENNELINNARNTTQYMNYLSQKN